MAKKPGVPLLKNWIKRKRTEPAQPQKTKLAQPEKKKAEKQVFLWDENSHEEGLEDTPVMSAQPAAPVSPIEPAVKSEAPAETPESRLAEKRISGGTVTGQPVESRASRETMKTQSEEKRSVSETAKGQPTERRAHAKRRKGFALAGVIGSAAAGISRLFTASRKKSKGNAAALEFADSRKRLGRKGRRNRRILVYSGSCLAVATVLLLVLLVPGGAAAPVDAQATGASGYIAEVTDTLSATDSASGTYSATATSTLAPTPTPIPTPSPTPIVTTAPDPTEEPIDIEELVEYFKVDADKYYNEMGYSTNHYNYTDEEEYILAQLIYGEARGETPTGKIAVANVVMNRVLCRGAWGNTIKAVVTAPGQFSGYSASIRPSRACISAARQVLKNEVWVIPQDIYYFRAVSKFSSLDGQDWGSHTFYKKIGGHYFYRHRYSGRMRGGGVPPALYDRTYKYPQYGCKPEDRVYRVQYMLDALGYDVDEVDSYFGKGTKEALIKFQEDHGLEGDGVAGPATLRKLINEYGMRDYYAKFCV